VTEEEKRRAVFLAREGATFAEIMTGLKMRSSVSRRKELRQFLSEQRISFLDQAPGSGEPLEVAEDVRARWERLIPSLKAKLVREILRDQP